jgi:hypothetical protein
VTVAARMVAASKAGATHERCDVFTVWSPWPNWAVEVLKASAPEVMTDA